MAHRRALPGTVVPWSPDFPRWSKLHRGRPALWLARYREMMAPLRVTLTMLLSSVASAQGEPRFILAMLRDYHSELPVRKVNRDLLECPKGVHAEQERRRPVELQLFEGVGLGENDGKVLNANSTDFQIADKHIIARHLGACHRFKLDLLLGIDKAATEQSVTQGLVADADFRTGIEHDH